MGLNDIVETEEKTEDTPTFTVGKKEKEDKEPEIDEEKEESEEEEDERVRKGGYFTLDGSVLGTFIEHRLSGDRDVKIIITSKGSTTGLGKTTLGIGICRYVEEILLPRVASHMDHGRHWKAEERGFIDIQKYISKYKSCNKYSSLLIDEIEHGADSRRSMAQDNVDLSHAWAQLRYRNIVSVATLPSVSMLDNRMMELADIWINVLERGKAICFYIWVNDFTGEVMKKTLEHPRNGATEVITWPDLAGDSDYEYMRQLKDTHVRVGEENKTYTKKEVEKEKKSAKKKVRDALIKDFYSNSNLSQADIAEIVDLSQSQVGNITRGES